MEIFNFLPSTLFHPPSTQSFGGDPIAKILADFGLGSAAHDTFGEFSDSLVDGLLSDPFDLSISPSFGVINDSFYSVGAGHLFEEGQEHLNDDLVTSGSRLESRRTRARNSYFAKRGDVSKANWTKKFLCDKICARTYFLSE